MTKFVPINFISTADRLPSKEGPYLCVCDTGYISILSYNTKHKLFNVSDNNTDTALKVLYWADWRYVLKTLKIGEEQQ